MNVSVHVHRLSKDGAQIRVSSMQPRCVVPTQIPGPHVVRYANSVMAKLGFTACLYLFFLVLKS